MKTPPFIVDVNEGCRAIVRAIEHERSIAFVPTWPWAILRYILKILPLRLMAKLS